MRQQQKVKIKPIQYLTKYREQFLQNNLQLICKQKQKIKKISQCKQGKQKTQKKLIFFIPSQHPVNATVGIMNPITTVIVKMAKNNNFGCTKICNERECCWMWHMRRSTSGVQSTTTSFGSSFLFISVVKDFTSISKILQCCLIFCMDQLSELIRLQELDNMTIEPNQNINIIATEKAKH